MKKAAAKIDQGLCPDTYMTDGIRLFRVVATLLDPWRGGEAAELEDCLTLRMTHYSAYALANLRLERVAVAA
jgi:hypothetical protein